MLKITDSHSKKGYGNGFIGLENRFSDNKTWHNKYLPGPGSYSSSAHQESLMGASFSTKFTDKYKSSNLSSVFMPHKNKSLKETNITPGPGSYKIEHNPSNNQLETMKQASEAAFKSSTKKSEYLLWNREQR